MRILVDIGHPVWVHFFRRAVEGWQRDGHEVLIAARDKDCTVALLEAFDLPYEVASRARGRGVWRLAREFAQRSLKIHKAIRAFRPDVIVTVNEPCGAQAGWLKGIPVVLFSDCELSTLEIRLSHPFADVVCKSVLAGGRVTPKTREYNSHPCLAYLDPRSFGNDSDLLARAGLDPDERYVVMRLVEWGAHHDIGKSGIPDPVEVVRELEPLARVIVSHERPLPAEIADLSMEALGIPPQLYHQLIYQADLLIAEGGNAMEAAFLGTPNVFLVSANVRMWDELDHQGLMRKARDQVDLLKIAKSILDDPSAKEGWRRRAVHAADSMDDMTAFTRRVVTCTAESAGRA